MGRKITLGISGFNYSFYWGRNNNDSDWDLRVLREQLSSSSPHDWLAYGFRFKLDNIFGLRF